MTTSDFFESLWNDYIKITPQADAVRHLFIRHGEEVINDHVAFRTFGDSPISLEKLEPVFEDLGYEAYGQYRFEQKKLAAKSFRHKTDDHAPKIFLSELKIDELSEPAQNAIRKLVAQIPDDIELNPSIFWSGRLWDMPSKEDYETLLDESEYAAWLGTIGIRVNHFTVSVNQLEGFKNLEDVNGLLKENGFALNSVGGEIKGTPELLLEQSSTMADKISVTFPNGEARTIPSCFYEFAKRYELEEGRLFQGFIEGNADKIFESTNVR